MQVVMVFRGLERCPTAAASQRSGRGGYDSLGGDSKVCRGRQGTREVDNFGSKDGEVRKSSNHA